MKLRVETEDAAAEEAVEQLIAPRADGERFGIRPRNVPERQDRGVGQSLADHPRQQREVIILDQHDGISRGGLVDDRVGEFLVDLAVILVITGAEGRAHMRDVAQRPQALVGESGVVAGFLLAGEPDPADLVERMLRWNGEPVVAVDGVAVGRAAAVRDPGARARAHHRFQRRHKAARGALDVHAAVLGAHVDVRLAVRYGDHVVAVQLAAQRRAQRLLVPDPLASVERAVLALEVADEIAQVARDRAQFRRRAGDARPEDALAAEQRMQSAHPAAPGNLRDHDGDERDRGAQGDEEIEKIAPELLVAALDEAHVVDKRQPGRGTHSAVDLLHGDVKRTRADVQQRLGLTVARLEVGAVERAREVRRRNRGIASRDAEADRVEPLVAQHPAEVLEYAWRRSFGDERHERIMHRGQR